MSEPSFDTFGVNWTQVEVREFVSRCYDRDALLSTLMGYASEWLGGRLVCIVTRDHLQPFLARGWASWGDDDETTREFMEVRVDIEEAPTLEHIVAEGIYAIGAPEEMGIEDLFDQTSVLPPDVLVIIPLLLGGRSKMLLIGEPDDADDDLETFSEEMLPLVNVATDVAAQLEEIVKLFKAKKLPPEGQRIPELPSQVRERLDRQAARLSKFASEPIFDDDDHELEEVTPPDVAVSVSEVHQTSSPSERLVNAPVVKPPPRHQEEESEVEPVSVQPDLERAVSDALSGAEEEDSAPEPGQVPRARVGMVPSLSKVDEQSDAEDDAERHDTQKLSAAEVNTRSAGRQTLPLSVEASRLRRGTAQNLSLRSPNEEAEDDMSATFTGNPLNVVDEMSRELEESESRDSLGREESNSLLKPEEIERLPDNPFEDDPNATHEQRARVRPRAERRGLLEEPKPAPPEPMPRAVKLDPNTPHPDEDEGVSIIKPIGLQQGNAKTTLVGGFSMEDLQRVVEDAERETQAAQSRLFESTPDAEPDDVDVSGATIHGIAPVKKPAPPRAKIFRKRRARHTPGPDSVTQHTPAPAPRPKPAPEPVPVRAVTEPNEHPRTAQTKQTLIMHAADPEDSIETLRMKVDENTFANPPSQPSQAPPLSPSNTAQIMSMDTFALEQGEGTESHAATLRDGREHVLTEASIKALSEANARSSVATVDATPDGSESDVELIEIPTEHPVSDSKAELSVAETDELKDLVLTLDSRSRPAAFEAAKKLSMYPGLIETLIDMFPGRLYVDRYQYPEDRLPTASMHGPLIAAIIHLGAEAAPVLEKFIDSTSNDLRFYATFTFTELPAPSSSLDNLRQRLFDKDVQIRAVARRAIAHAWQTEDFERKILLPMRGVLQANHDDTSVETAAHVLGLVRDTESIERLIYTMEGHRLRTVQAIHTALQRITLQPLPAAFVAWRTWWNTAKEEDRRLWFLRAATSSSDVLRKYVQEEVTMRSIPIDYRADAPNSERVAAQLELKTWLETHHV